MSQQTKAQSILSLGIFLLMCSCDIKTDNIRTHYSPDFKMPETKLPDIRISDILLNTCNKKDEEMKFSSEALQNTLIVEDNIEVKDIEQVDCNDKVTKKDHGPVRTLYKMMVITPPHDLKGPVKYAKISNERTCKQQVVGSSPGIFSISVLTPEAQLDLVLTGSTSMLELALNAQEGNNPIKIQYLGKCLKYREKIEPKLGDEYNCEKAELLATQEILLKIRINYSEASGVERIKNCPR